MLWSSSTVMVASMADHSAIEWTDSTFNPWIGCTKVSPACDHCYAAVSTPARALGIAWGAGQPRRRTSVANWKLPLRWDRMDRVKLSAWEQLKHQYHGLTDTELEAKGFTKPQRRRVFCASLADVFDNEVDPSWRRDLFELVRETPSLDWLLLTKRIGNVRAMLEQQKVQKARYEEEYRFFDDWLAGKPPSNVWLGATVCDQAEADRDVPKLLAVPAAVHWLSCEPLLGPVDFYQSSGHWSQRGYEPWRNAPILTGINWVVVGGESGHGARPMHPDWARSLRDQCARAGVPFFFKQWGEFAPYGLYDFAPDDPRPINKAIVFHPPGVKPADMIPIGKKTAGRGLDGVEHNAYPETTR
jgi:protein gp37